MRWPVVPRERFPAVSSLEMRQADADAGRLFGIDPLQLMEVAGFQVARFVEGWLDGVAGKRIAVVAGSGNNGGDALVAARHLQSRGARVSVRLSSASFSDLAAHQLHIARKLQIACPPMGGPLDPDAAIIVDGLLGTGVRLPLRPQAHATVAAMNAAGPPIVAIDIPSGLDADTGSGGPVAVQAAATLTLGLPKIGLLAGLPAAGGRQAVGRLFLADIGLPPAVFGDRAEAVRAIYGMGDLVELT